ncbi:MAG TPA: ABC transporter substrate-binding protein [Steroidobacteraceae bacterium]|jgi:ABC-type transport system substrate-binding protein/ABC-type dipeptide/oligopeptide/nickel transport system permease component|nr:ABC transporter substrate-binding protein [Steroidobacteraceae bacterium]
MNPAAMGLLGVLLLASPAQGAQRMIIGTQLEPPVLDPTANPAAAISEVLYQNVYEGLVQFAADGTVLPKLARSWEVSSDGLTYVFHLKNGVRFHDGSEFNAAAAKFSLDRILAPGSVNPQKSRFQAIRAIEVADPLTLRLRLSRRSGGLLQSLAFGSAAMLSPKSAQNDALHPIGTGPFRFLRWRRGDSITLERNPDYHGARAVLGQVTFKFITDPTAAFAALMAGDVDAFSNYPAPESFTQFAADRRFRVLTGTTEMETVLGLNERVAPLNNVLVRRAISHALDRRAIIDGAMFGYGTPIGSHFPPGNPAYVDLTGVYPHDPAKARALLAQAGYPRGFPMTLKLPPPSYARRSGEIVAAQLAQVGIRVSIENLEWAQWLDQVYTRHDFDMSIVGHAEPLDYDIYARDDYYFGYSNPQFKALIAALDDSVDASVRKDLLQQIQRKLAEDAVNGFLFQYPRLDIWNAHLHGIGFDNVLGTVDVTQAYFDGGAHIDHDDEAAGAPIRGPSFSAAALLLCAAALLMLHLVMRRFGSAYVAQRLGVLLATLLAATAVVFLIVQVVPGDPVRYMLGLQAEPATVAALRHQLGLDAGPLQRYLSWLGGLLHLDFGVSYTYRIPVRALLAERLQVSLPLAAYALLLSTVLAVPLAVYGAAKRRRTGDAIVSGMTQIGLAVPNFWLGMLLVLIFAIGLRWVSAGGFPGWEAGFWPAVKALTLPAVALAMPQAAILARVLRGALIETLHEDYIRTARAKGAGEWRVLIRHALPNALIPVLTILGMQFSFLLAGGVIIENVFFLPGLGRLVFQAIVQRDLIVVQSVVVVLVFAVVTVTFLVDLGYVLINPQLRGAHGGGA